MKKLKILQKNDKKLRRIAEEIKVFDAGLCTQARELMECLVESNGIGIAAPQVGWNIRLIIVYTEAFGGVNMVMVNPRIIDKQGEEVGQEGCLSVRGEFGMVKRAKEITIEYQDLDGKKFLYPCSDLTARCIQHEIDHLDGILFIDKLEE